jgi:ribosomal protein S3
MATAATQIDQVRTSGDEQPIPAGWHRALIDMSPEVYEFLEQLAKQTGTSKVDVLRKALGLYRVALDARREGLVVGAVSEDQALDTEFVGF